jgi:ribosomal protein S18 acetylase RimI-like enzyme
MQIRDYRSGDGEALRALWTGVGLPLVGDDDPGLEAFAARNPGLFLVVEADGRLVGSAMGGWDGRRGWIYHVAVAPDHRRQSLANRLVDRIEDGLRAVGCVRVNVIVERGNDGGMAFWSAQGYEQRDSYQFGKFL